MSNESFGFREFRHREVPRVLQQSAVRNFYISLRLVQNLQKSVAIILLLWDTFTSLP